MWYWGPYALVDCIWTKISWWNCFHGDQMVPGEAAPLEWWTYWYFPHVTDKILKV